MSVQPPRDSDTLLLVCCTAAGFALVTVAVAFLLARLIDGGAA